MDRRFNLRHFAALAATVRYGSLTRAARAVHLTQSALTQAIQSLESTLATQLFEREARGMRPLDAAHLLSPRAEAAIRHVGSARVTGTQMRAFLAVARGGSYSAAAEATSLAPASVHRAVADLSLALGQRLVERRGKGIALTEAGTRRARGFSLAMAELRAGVDEIAALRGLAVGRIAIGAMPLCRARWLPETIARFTAKFPAIDLALHEGSHAELVGPLRDGEIDFMLGALREEGNLRDLRQEPVFDDRPVIVMRAGHPLARSTNLEAELFAYPWILSSRGTPLRQHWESMIRALGREPPHVAVECGSVMMLRQLLLAGEGLTLLSRDQVSVELNAGVLASIAPKIAVTRTIGITTRHGWRPTTAQARFVELLREAGSG